MFYFTCDRSFKANTHRRRRRDSTVELSCVGGVNGPVGSRAQFPISCAVGLLRLVTKDDIMTSLLTKLSISIKIHAYSQTAMESVWSVSKLSTDSVGSRRQRVANSVHTADADAMQLDS